MNPDEHRYQTWEEEQQQKRESLCGRCGACCGAAEGDPCEHLEKLDNGRHWCTIYDNRFGVHKTRGDKPFLCVPVRDILHNPGRGIVAVVIKNTVSGNPMIRITGYPDHPVADPRMPG